MGEGRPCGVLCRIAAALAEIFAEAQAEGLLLRPTEVAKRAKVPRQVVGEVFKALARRGYMECVKTARGLRCAVPLGSRRWPGGDTWSASRRQEG
jgi:hypothetical protein